MSSRSPVRIRRVALRFMSVETRLLPLLQPRSSSLLTAALLPSGSHLPYVSTVSLMEAGFSMLRFRRGRFGVPELPLDVGRAPCCSNSLAKLCRRECGVKWRDSLARMASLPSSRRTCRGTTPRRRAMSVRASASTPSTSSSRRASASRPSPTWTRTRRSSLPRWPEEQRRDADEGSLGSSLGNHAS
jgi:hypothetical protein